MKNDNIIAEKSKSFALRIIKLYKYLSNEQNEYVLSKQILRSGTSIGANIREAIRGQSSADFYAKMNISLKESEETLYWLELLHESGYIETAHFNSIYDDCKSITKILMSITKSQKNNHINPIRCYLACQLYKFSPAIAHCELRIANYTKG